MKYQYNSEMQYTNQKIVTTTGIPVKNKVIFGMGIFHTGPATGQKSMCARYPTGTVLAASFSKFVRQWRKNATSAEHCTSIHTAMRISQLQEQVYLQLQLKDGCSDIHMINQENLRTSKLQNFCTLSVLNPIALREAKIVYNFGLSECSRVKMLLQAVY